LTSAYLLLLLIPVFVVLYVLWDYRRRTAQRDNATAERLQDVILVAAKVPRTAQARGGNTTSASADTKVGAPIISYVRRDRLLSPPQTLLYYLLRSELPDHLVFAQMTLSSVLDTAPGVAEHARSEMARRLADHRVDFVICDRRMHPVAVLKIQNSPDSTSNELSSAQRWLDEAGVRYVDIDARALPRKEAVRALALGEGDATERADASTETAA
jgi:uncharacterized protein DUF2726